ncbi:hypothetical protein K1719_041169 [Acacia pycnantha]|nr:hypothetical protein K1719_041169 [Acacia pycnantha]
MAGSDGAEHGETAQEEQKFVDPLDKFLPSPPKIKCSEDLQGKINKFLEYKKARKSFNAEDLVSIMMYSTLMDISDYYDKIEADMRCDSDRKELEKKKAQKVEFASGRAQPRIVTGVSRINVPVTGSFVSLGRTKNQSGTRWMVIGKILWGRILGLLVRFMLQYYLLRMLVWIHAFCAAKTTRGRGENIN